MKQGKGIAIDYLARVEGETSIVVELGGRPSIELRIFEPPRFFEGFLVGRNFDEVGDIVSRICGICPISHMTTAIHAIERAMGITVSPQTVILRDIMSVSQIVASHLVHLYMLAMPDYYGRAGFIEMTPDLGKGAGRLVEMKEIINGLAGLIGGRALHPVTHLPGGFTRIPPPGALLPWMEKLKGIRRHAAKLVEDIAALDVPDFHTTPEFVALDGEGSYSVNQGDIVSSGGLRISADEYPQNFSESETPYAFAKYSTLKGGASFMVGALARMNLKFDKLDPRTKEEAARAGFSLPCDNPFYNNLAQALEVVEGIEQCIRLASALDLKHEERRVMIKSGEAGAATEAPRGLLYHWYRINRQGIVEKANIVSPTAHNFLNIEKDLKKLAQENIHRKRDDIAALCEKLVRAYDPCFSCSVH